HQPGSETEPEETSHIRSIRHPDAYGRAARTVYEVNEVTTARIGGPGYRFTMTSARLAAVAIVSLFVACAAPVDDESPSSAVETTSRPTGEYLAPGVYVSETPFRSTPIPGVSTSSAVQYVVVGDAGR